MENSETTSARSITAASKSNLALAFAALPREKQDAMAALYAFCRVVDDVADSTELSPEEKQRQLEFWRAEIARAYSPEEQPQSELMRALAAAIRRYQVPRNAVEEILAGVEMDLRASRYETFADLRKYCDRVAGAVGLASIAIFECRCPQSEQYALALGMAFQLTNILRDVGKDAAIGRVYLPQEELRAFGVREEEIFARQWSPAMERLLRFQYLRAKHFFAQAQRWIIEADRPKLVAAEIMRGVYGKILEEIAAKDFRVLDPARPVRLGRWQKAWTFLRARHAAVADKPKHSHAPPKHVAVIGGGYAGLAAAAELILRGHRVTLIEGKPLWGGRAHSFTDHASGEVLDNGQHIVMGCYRATRALLETLGAQERIAWQPRLEIHYAGNRGRSRMRACALPGALGLLGALLGFRELSARDKAAAIGLCLKLKCAALPEESETAHAWLARWRQTPGAVRALWEPFCLAALNLPLREASARLLAQVIGQALLAGGEAARLGWARVGLSELFAPEAARLVELCGGEVVLGTPVASLEFDQQQVRAAALRDGRRIQADHFVSAVNWQAAAHLLPPGHALANLANAMGESPIVNLSLWFDRQFLQQPFVGLLDSPVHWLFDNTQVHGAAERKNASEGFLHSVVISGARTLAHAPREELEALAVAEIQRLLPEARGARLVRRFLYRAKGATFNATPEVDALRPPAATSWRNLWLAGDWTQTGLPGTIEGAVVSGQRAAREVDASWA